ncbi:hypothetical protein BY996DRAFT_4574921 [Phakopsora pachyrhizi]|uniref:NudC domain-containing protein 1 n=1 Tax=Phakopsora pachyrhizi TaxID=170000 RepID=A0AAV0AQ10_PHAPC|nr:hypothetical protein BY996DRAFT_4574921 [Phakopsora pachyrhizi]CAH7669902.1 expressed protein [Phakopsora pachyrhizi]
MNGIDGICFNCSRDLLNPKFETYKLKEFDSSNVSRIKLPNWIDFSLPDDEVDWLYNFQELRSRSRWNHLLLRSNHKDLNDNENQSKAVDFIWIDPMTLKIWTLVFKDEQTLSEPNIRLLCGLSDKRKDSLKSEDAKIPLDFPSGFNLRIKDQRFRNVWLVLDGSRHLSLVDLTLKAPKILIDSFKLNQDFFEKDHVENFRLIALEPKQEETQNDTIKSFWLVLRSKSRKKADDQDINNKLVPFYKIHVLELQLLINLGSLKTEDIGYKIELKLLTQLIGTDDVESTRFDPINSRWCFGSSSTFEILDNEVRKTQINFHPSNELQDTGSPEKTIDNDYQNSQKSITVNSKHRPFDQSNSLYTWYQDSTSLTIVFPIKSAISTKNLKLSFNSKDSFKLDFFNLDQSLQSDLLENFYDKLQEENRYKFDRSNFSTKKIDDKDNILTISIDFKLWNQIKSDQSIWYIELTKDRNSLLTIELEKNEDSLRWIQIFKDDDSVLESLDPLELKSMANRIDRYTNDENGEKDDEIDSSLVNPTKKQKTHNNKKGLGLNGSESRSTNINSLSTSNSTALNNLEIDEEIDLGDQSMKIGILYTWLIKTSDGDDDKIDIWRSLTPQKELPVEVISSPLPLILKSQKSSVKKDYQGSKDFTETTMIKRDTEGLVFKFPDSSKSDKKEQSLTDPSSLNYRWNHTLTYPGLAFVMATKRDIRSSFYLNDRFVLVFENQNLSHNRCHQEQKFDQSIGNLFVYHHYSKDKSHPIGNGNDKDLKNKSLFAEQNVIKLSKTIYNPTNNNGDDSSNSTGYLLGVIGFLFKNPHGSKTSCEDAMNCSNFVERKEEDQDSVLVLCLCQSELILIKM